MSSNSESNNLISVVLGGLCGLEQQTRRNNPAKMKQAKIAEMNGEMLPEEIEFKKDKDQLEKDLFRLQVLENIIKSDKESNDEALKSIEEHYDKSKEALRYTILMKLFL